MSTSSLRPNYMIEAILDLMKRGGGSSNANNHGPGPFRCLVCDEGAIRHPVSFIYAIVAHSGVSAPEFEYFTGRDGLQYCRMFFADQEFVSELGHKKARKAKIEACTIACESLFGDDWARTVLNEKGAGGRGERHPVTPHLSILIPHRSPMDPDLHDDPIGAVNSICKSYGIPTPIYQPFPGQAFRQRITCVISFMNENFISAALPTIRDAMQDCARRILVFLLECGYQPRKKALIESLEYAFEALNLDEGERLELFAKHRMHTIPSN